MASLSEEAKEGLAVLGKWCASQNRSFDTHTFRRKMIAKLRDSEMDSDSVLKELKQAQLIRRHKENVWTLTKDGFKLAYFVLKEKQNENYPGLTIRKRP